MATLKCDKCDKTFARPQALGAHNRYVHGKGRTKKAAKATKRGRRGRRGAGTGARRGRKQLEVLNRPPEIPLVEVLVQARNGGRSAKTVRRFAVYSEDPGGIAESVRKALRA